MVGSATQVLWGPGMFTMLITLGPALGPGDAEALFIGELDTMWLTTF